MNYSVPFILIIVVAAASLAACDSGNEPSVEIEDIIQGSGEEAAGSDVVTIEYIGMFEDGEVFDSSAQWGPLRFQLESRMIYDPPEARNGRVIPGLSRGMPGMKVGGVRRITIPPELAYGRNGDETGTIPPDATLVFEVELIALDKA